MNLSFKAQTAPKSCSARTSLMVPSRRLSLRLFTVLLALPCLLVGPTASTLPIALARASSATAWVEGHVYLYCPTAPGGATDVTDQVKTTTSGTYLVQNGVCVPITIKWTEGHVYNTANQSIGFVGRPVLK